MVASKEDGTECCVELGIVMEISYTMEVIPTD